MFNQTTTFTIAELQQFEKDLANFRREAGAEILEEMNYFGDEFYED